MPHTGQPPIETSIAPIGTPLNPLAFGAPFGRASLHQVWNAMPNSGSSLGQSGSSLGQSAPSLRQVCVKSASSLGQVCDSLGKSATVWAGATWPQLAPLVLQKNILAKVKISSYDSVATLLLS